MSPDNYRVFEHEKSSSHSSRTVIMRYTRSTKPQGQARPVPMYQKVEVLNLD